MTKPILIVRSPKASDNTEKIVRAKTNNQYHVILVIGSPESELSFELLSSEGLKPGELKELRKEVFNHNKKQSLTVVTNEKATV